MSTPLSDTFALAYQRCGACENTWYFARRFCPACGAAEPQARLSAGLGVVYARTLVHRAPSDEFRALAPYAMVLVDLAEGFRAMGHADPVLSIGDPVKASSLQIAGRAIPYFTRTTP
ncbi:Zn-ribbon domain-containing OB-fold protein [Hydrogenophaga sp.]|uniref:Zn-ribbon domain-containing OB-fold protein n=1 Tax=Hydrogenophaga sp. TaxID=1904254 RepID=UPI0027189688|nr:OB-fold domain-containing protein [Hydrogenophaga sp.]MDO9436555.1 OB-fold domain-containing protein [Hydrogenophaga sp.]